MGNIKVLMVEDDPYLREYYKRLLERDGAKMHIADDGAEGLAMMKSDQYDVILLDVMLPRLTGFDVLERLRSEEVKHGPVIILTDLDKMGVEEKARELGAVAFMAKHETTGPDLRNKIEEVIREHSC